MLETQQHRPYYHNMLLVEKISVFVSPSRLSKLIWPLGVFLAAFKMVAMPATSISFLLLNEGTYIYLKNSRSVFRLSTTCAARFSFTKLVEASAVRYECLGGSFWHSIQVWTIRATSQEIRLCWNWKAEISFVTVLSLPVAQESSDCPVIELKALFQFIFYGFGSGLTWPLQISMKGSNADGHCYDAALVLSQ